MVRCNQGAESAAGGGRIENAEAPQKKTKGGHCSTVGGLGKATSGCGVQAAGWQQGSRQGSFSWGFAGEPGECFLFWNQAPTPFARRIDSHPHTTFNPAPSIRP